MGKARAKEWPDSLGPLPPSGTVEVTCGWCITGNCDACIVSILSVLTNKTYVCDCEHKEEQ